MKCPYCGHPDEVHDFTSSTSNWRRIPCDDCPHGWCVVNKK